MLGLNKERLGCGGLKGFQLDLVAPAPWAPSKAEDKFHEADGAGVYSSDFRKLGTRESIPYSQLIVRHPRRKMALDSPDRVCTHGHTDTHTYMHVHIPMCKQLHTCSYRDTCWHADIQHEQYTGTSSHMYRQTREHNMHTTWQFSDLSALDSTSQDPFRVQGA